MSVNGVAFVLIVCWGAVAIGVVIVVARQFARWDRDNDEAEVDAHLHGDDEKKDAKRPR